MAGLGHPAEPRTSQGYRERGWRFCDVTRRGAESMASVTDY
jgi:hypothetical protein